MREFLKENWVTIAGLAIISNAIAYGVSDFLPYTKTLALCLPLITIVFYYMERPKEDGSKAGELIQELDAIIGEQTQVIEEYEKIFDKQLVELPCVCGGNTFQGLFTPNTDNIVECEKCKNKYRVTVNYDSVMISEPLNIDQTFNELVGKTID
jgi:hypothetical protein